jgi:hypothetical protein
MSGNFTSTADILNISGNDNVNIEANTTTGTTGGIITMTSGSGVGSVSGDGGKFIAIGGSGTGATGAGGSVTFTGGLSASGQGGIVTITAGNGNGTGSGGDVSLSGGNTGGDVNLSGGNAISSNGNGGAVAITSGNGSGTGSGGNLTYSAGSDNTGFAGAMDLDQSIFNISLSDGGGIIMSGGDTGTGTSVNGSGVILTAGISSSTNGNGGNFALTAGNGSGTGNGGDVTLTTGDGTTDGKLNFSFQGETTGAIRYVWPSTIPTAGQRIIVLSVTGTNPTIMTMGFENIQLPFPSMATTITCTNWASFSGTIFVVAFSTIGVVVTSTGTLLPILNGEWVFLEENYVYSVYVSYFIDFTANAQVLRFVAEDGNGLVLNQVVQTTLSNNVNTNSSSQDTINFTVNATSFESSRFRLRYDNGTRSTFDMTMTIVRVG